MDTNWDTEPKSKRVSVRLRHVRAALLSQLGNANSAFLSRFRRLPQQSKRSLGAKPRKIPNGVLD
jgi:hypothetical protein